MPASKNNMKVENTKLFFDSFANNSYYLFGSSFKETTLVDSNSTENDILERSNFGVKIDSANGVFGESGDVHYVIENKQYSSNTVYTQYDDTVNITDDDFYAVVNEDDTENSDYHVFKCLFNNYDSKSTQKPIFDANTNIIRNSEDGYVWRYMYTVTNALYKKYSVKSFVPVIKDDNVINNANDGIDIIVVENPQTNSGYEKIVGTATNYSASEDELTLSIDFTNSIFNSEGSSEEKLSNFKLSPSEFDIKITDGNNESELFNILSYKNVSGSRVITIDSSSGITGSGDSWFNTGGGGKLTNYSIEILPRIIMYGDGTGVRAYPVINSTTGVITDIIVIDSGSGYTAGRAVIAHTNQGIVDANIRPVIPPKGGHGSDPVTELFSTQVSIYGRVTSLFSTGIPDTGEYNVVSLVKNPSFSNTEPDNFDNRLYVEFEDANNNIFTSNDYVVSLNSDGDIGARGYVDEVGNNHVYIREFLDNCCYRGTYSSSFEYLFATLSDLHLYDYDLDLEVFGTKNAKINSIESSDYVQKSGNVLHFIELEDSVQRDSDNIEVYRLIIDF